MDLIDTGIVSLEIVDIFLMTAVIAEDTDDISELRIVSGDSTCIAESAKVLARIETVTSGIAKSTSLAVAKSTSMSLGIILNEFQPMLATDIPYPIRIGTASIEMDNHNGTSARGDGLFDEDIVYLERIDVRLYKHRLKAVLCNGEDGSDIGIGWHDDFVTLLHHAHLNISTENQCQGIEAIAATNTIAYTNIVSIGLLEATGIVALQIPTTLQHLIGSMRVGLVYRQQIQVLHHKSYSYQS